MTIALTQVDAFTATPFGGNQAFVCVLPGPCDVSLGETGPGSAAWMSAVARETDAPATAFVHPNGNGFGIRWFTATTELALCGHGTLASAHVLYETGTVKGGETIQFQSPSGSLTASRQDGWIELNFPAAPEESIAPPPGLLEALGVEAVYVGRGRLDCLVEVADESIVRAVTPDLARLREVKTRGVIVTSRSATPDRDFVSRFFAPSVGFGEDAVTGSAHCCLGPYWAKRLNKTAFTAHQLSARGGVLKVSVHGDRVRIAGQAVTVFRGELVV